LHQAASTASAGGLEDSLLPAIPQEIVLSFVLFGCCAATRTLAEIFHAIYACVNV